MTYAVRKTSWFLPPFTFFAFVFSACSEGKLTDFGAPYEAFVIDYVPPVGDISASGQFAFIPKMIPTLQNLGTLESSNFKVVQGGELIAKRVQGSLLEASQFGGGTSPRLKLRSEGRRLVPLDYQSLAMLSAFAQFERVSASVPELTGLEASEFRSWLGQFPVLFEPSIRILGESGTLVSALKLNAAYIPEAKQFVLFQRSRVERVPLAVNLQVIAHEFGHALFEYLFFNGSYRACGRLEQEFTMRGLNEGFADFFAFTLSGSTDILGASFGQSRASAERNFGRASFRYADSTVSCNGGFYCTGTLFARALLDSLKENSTDVSQTEQRAAFFRRVVSGLQKTREPMLADEKSLLPPVSPEVGRCEATEEFAAHDGKVSGAFFKAFLDNSDERLRSSLCRTLNAYFGTAGFSVDARKGTCP